MQTANLLVRCSLLAGALLVCYLISFWLLLRAHLTTGRMSGSSITTSFLQLKDTPLNRGVIAFYAPILKAPWFAVPVEWE